MKCKSVAYFLWRGEAGNGTISSLLPCLPALSPLLLMSPLWSPGGWKGSAPLLHLGSRSLEKPPLPARGLRFCPRFLFSLFERQRQQPWERCCQYFSVLDAVIATPSPRSFFRPCFIPSHLPPPLLNLNTKDILCIYLCIKPSGEPQTIAICNIFLLCLLPRTNVHPLEG